MSSAVRRAFALTALALSALAAAVACGDAADALEGTSSSGGAYDASAGRDGGPSAISDAGATPISANGLVLVHAASFPAFRICFDGTPEEQPIPAADLMPSSNIPGLEMGTALRLAPRPGALGNAYIYREEVIRNLYFPSPESGPSCGRLRKSTTIEYLQVATALPDLSIGVHLLVLQGCGTLAIDPLASVDRCGATWTSGSGNLELTRISVDAFNRPPSGGIPIQLVQLSHDLDQRAQTQLLGLSFGPLDGGAPPPIVEGMVPLGKPVPDPPASIDTTKTELADFDTNGVFVTLGAPIDDAGKPVLDAGDAGPRTVLLAQSLAEIQRRSSPRSLPPEWFATASSYVVLSVGEIDPKNPDGGPGDERRGLHLLAVPLAAPDGGSQPVISDAGFDANATD